MKEERTPADTTRRGNAAHEMITPDSEEHQDPFIVLPVAHILILRIELAPPFSDLTIRAALYIFIRNRK
jgi:hypothetical protein